MVAVVILAILVALAFPIYNRTVERSRMSEAYTHLSAVKDAALAYYNRYYTYPSLLNQLTIDNPNNIPIQTRYFNYDTFFVSSGEPPTGFTYSCTRNSTNNSGAYSYQIWINQDGEIGNTFYGNP
jgi:Tfp pilus assembly protein PilE